MIFAGPKSGSIGALIDAFFEHPSFDQVGDGTQRYYRGILTRARGFLLRTGKFAGRTFENVPVDRIDVGVAKQFAFDFNNLGMRVTRPDATNNLRETLRRVYNAMIGEFPQVPFDNVWRRVEHFKHYSIETFPGDLAHYAMFDWAARGLQQPKPNIGTAALAVFELQIRAEAVLTSFLCEHWKPASRPRQVFVIRPKVRNSRWMNLYDANGEPLYPAIEKRLDELKGTRQTGILIPKDGTVDEPWAAPGQSLPNAFYDLFDMIKQAANLPEELKWTSFRHGGITESAEAGCTEAELMSLSGHKDVATAQHYIHMTQMMMGNAQQKRISHRARVIQALLASGRLDAILDQGDFSDLIAQLTPLLTTDLAVH